MYLVCITLIYVFTQKFFCFFTTSDRLFDKADGNAGPDIVIHQPSPSRWCQFPSMCPVQTLGGKLYFYKIRCLFVPRVTLEHKMHNQTHVTYRTVSDYTGLHSLSDDHKVIYIVHVKISSCDISFGFRSAGRLTCSSLGLVVERNSWTIHVVDSDCCQPQYAVVIST